MRDSHIASYVQKAVLEAAMELWKDDIATGKKIVRERLTDAYYLQYFKELVIHPEFISGVSIRGTYFFRYVAVLPDETEEELLMLGLHNHYHGSTKIKVSWDEIPLLETLSHKAILIEQAFTIIAEDTMDEIKKKHPWLLKFFDAAYETWSITYRAVEAIASVSDLAGVL